MKQLQMIDLSAFSISATEQKEEEGQEVETKSWSMESGIAGRVSGEEGDQGEVRSLNLVPLNVRVLDLPVVTGMLGKIRRQRGGQNHGPWKMG